MEDQGDRRGNFKIELIRAATVDRPLPDLKVVFDNRSGSKPLWVQEVDGSLFGSVYVVCGRETLNMTYDMGRFGHHKSIEV